MALKTRLRRLTRYVGSGMQYWSYRLGHAQQDETSCRFIGSHGLKKICDYWHPHGKPPIIERLEKLPRHSKSPPTIYVKPDHLHEFADRIQDGPEDAYILVTGCSDININSNAVDADLRTRLLDDPRLRSWFAQNCDIDHPKVHRLPIGLDYHTLTHGIEFSPWGHFASPVSQEASLDEARRNAPQLAEKNLVGYCNWHHVLDRGDRLRCINAVAYENIHLERLNTERVLSWQNNAKHLFTISPLGEGLDCHRTWEAILVGTVPIVPRTGISSLFANLPVCVVDDWSEVTVDYLGQKREWALDTKFDFAPLYLDWWRRRFVGMDDLPERVQTFQAFVDTAHQPLAPATGRMPKAA